MTSRKLKRDVVAIRYHENDGTSWDGLEYRDRVEDELLSKAQERGFNMGFIILPDVPITLERLADLCDHNAEQSNNHDFIGTHRLLAAILFRQLGRDKATDILLEIAQRSGLDGMSGRFGKGDHYKDLQVPEAWEDEWGWTLKEPT